MLIMHLWWLGKLISDFTSLDFQLVLLIPLKELLVLEMELIVGLSFSFGALMKWIYPLLTSFNQS